LDEPLSPKIDSSLTLIADKFQSRFTPIGKIGKRLFVQTDKDAPKNKIIEIDLDNPGPNNWKEALPESANVLQGAAIVGGKLVVQYLVDATDRLEIHDLNGRLEKQFELPALGSGLEFFGFSPHRSRGVGVNRVEETAPWSLIFRCLSYLRWEAKWYRLGSQQRDHNEFPDIYKFGSENRYLG